MKKTLLCLAVFAAVTAMPALAEIEIGLGFSPPLIERPEGAMETDNPLEDIMLSFHGGYSFLWLFYASVDSIVLPPYVVQNLTATWDPDNMVQQDGVYRPGFITLIDVGIRPRIGPFALMASVGINLLHVYKQKELPEDAFEPSLGVNARAGAYLFLSKHLALTATATTVFSNFKEMALTFDALAGDDEWMADLAMERLLSGLYPMVGLVFTF